MLNLALKYRPKSLLDLVGQEPNVRILSNVIGNFVETGEIPAVFLFAGSRGTGKTTSARILAKLLNCDNLVKHDAYVSCQECSSCRAIESFSCIDVIEIDAASHGNVESVRGLKDRTCYQSAAKNRVFIIDEVHSMSKEAFDALLKLFEEPPEATVFILCTTEPEKLPDTILSRAMLFEFRRIGEEEVAGRIEYVAGLEGIDISTDVVKMLAARVNGSMRDALICLTQLSLYVGKNGRVDEHAYETLFGVQGRKYFEQIIATLVSRDVATGFQLISKFYASAGELVLVDGLTDVFCSMLVDYAAGKKTMFKDADIIAAIRLLWDTRVKVKYTGVNTRTMLELMYAMLVSTLNPSMSRYTSGVKPVVSGQTAGMQDLANVFGG